VTRLEQAVTELVGTKAMPGLYAALVGLVLVKAQNQSDESSHAKISASPYPGETAIASWLGDVRAGTRVAEGELRIDLGFNSIQRGGSDNNTLASLRSLPELTKRLTERLGTCPRTTGRHGLGCGAYGYAPHVVEPVVEGWVNRARVLLQVDDPWLPIPSPPDTVDENGNKVSQQRLCPYCGLPALRWQERGRRMRCANQECVDPGGRPPFWSSADMEFLARDLFLADLRDEAS
jgi:hypothetical protein